MQKLLVTAIVTLSMGVCLKVSALSAGSIFFTSWNSDGNDEFSFVLLEAISGSTTIYFTDRGWDTGGNTWYSGSLEGTLVWTFTGALSCGTEISINPVMSSASQGTVSKSGSFLLSAAGDQIYAYEGNGIPNDGTEVNTWLCAFNSNGITGWTSAPSSSNQGGLPSGLTNGVNAMTATGSTPDNWVYNCTSTSDYALKLREALIDVLNWTTSNTITYAAPSCITSCIAPITYNPSFAFEGNGQNSYFQVGEGVSATHSKLGLTNNALTVEAWVYIRSFVDSAGVIGYAQSNGPVQTGWSMGCSSSNGGRVFFTLAKNGGAHNFNDTYPIDKGKWVHLAFSYDGAIHRGYINGVKKFSRAEPGGISYSNGKLVIGAFMDDDESYHFDGWIDEVRIWNVKRSQAEIIAGMGNSIPLTSNGLLYYFRMDGKDDVGDTLFNAVNGLNGLMPSGSWDSQNTLTSAAPDTIWKWWNGNGWHPSVPTSNDGVVIASDMNINSDSEYSHVYIRNGKVCTIDSSYSLNVKESLINDGQLVVNNGGSLLQSGGSIVSDEGTGIYTVKRKSSMLMDNSRYNFWSSPFADERINDVFPAANPNDFYSYNNGPWTSANNVIMKPGFGYTSSGDVGATYPVAFERSFSGKELNNDTIIVSGLGMDYNDYILLGNPYPGILDLDKLKGDNPNLSTSFWFWSHNTPGSDSTMDYAMYVKGVGGVAAASGGDVPDQFVAPCQGFMTQINSGNAIGFNNSQRSLQAGGGFFKGAIDKRQLIWLGLGSSRGFSNQILLGLLDNASESFDELDGPKLAGSADLSFYSLVDSVRCAVQSQPPEEGWQARTFLLGFETQNAGRYGITIDTTFGMPGSIPVILEDLYKDRLVDLQKAPYQFEVIKPGTYDDRFVLRFQSSKVLSDPIDRKPEFTLQMRPSVWHVESAAEIVSNAILYSLDGRQVQAAINVKSTIVPIEVAHLKSGVYILHLQFLNGQTSVIKILKSK